MKCVSYYIPLILTLLILGCGEQSKNSQEEQNSLNTETKITVDTTKEILVSYGNHGEIIFKWDKTTHTKETLYNSLSLNKDETAQKIIAYDTPDDYILTCIPQRQEEEQLLYICNNNATMILDTIKNNYIFLDKEEVQALTQVASIQILKTITYTK